MPKKKIKTQCAQCCEEKTSTRTTPKNPTPLCFECRLKLALKELEVELAATK